MPPEASQKVGVALGSLENVPLHAVRLTPENGTCGWYIYGGDYSPDADFYQPLHVATCSSAVRTLSLTWHYRRGGVYCLRLTMRMSGSMVSCWSLKARNGHERSVDIDVIIAENR